MTTYYEYDGSGNTVAKQEAAGTAYYQYDYENLMTRIDFSDDSHNYFAYDADSKRVEKRDSAGYARFIYRGPDMLRLLQEQNESDEAAVHYTMGAALEVMRRANGGELSGGASSFYHFDALGSAFDLTGINEAITDTWLYNAWGETLARTGTTTNPHAYVGRARYYRMPKPGLYHLGFRDYVPAIGRFMSRDPLTGLPTVGRFVSADPAAEASQDARSLHRYLYVSNDPVNDSDATGLMHPALAIAIIIAAFGALCGSVGALAGYLEGVEHGDNDKIAHCVAACEIRKCGTIVSSWSWGIVKEAFDAVFGDGWDEGDLAANRTGEECAVNPKYQKCVFGSKIADCGECCESEL